MCGKFTAMAFWVEVVAFSHPHTLSTEFAESDRMPAFLDPNDWEVWLGQGGHDPAAAKAACKTTEGIRWMMTKEERKGSQKRGKPTVSDPGGVL